MHNHFQQCILYRVYTVKATKPSAASLVLSMANFKTLTLWISLSCRASNTTRTWYRTVVSGSCSSESSGTTGLIRMTVRTWEKEWSYRALNADKFDSLYRPILWDAYQRRTNPGTRDWIWFLSNPSVVSVSHVLQIRWLKTRKRGTTTIPGEYVESAQKQRNSVYEILLTLISTYDS